MYVNKLSGDCDVRGIVCFWLYFVNRFLLIIVINIMVIVGYFVFDGSEYSCFGMVGISLEDISENGVSFGGGFVCINFFMW